uniref:small monomeric GTPase n=1 Tax=Pavo cristatus TaxID=9049 RepID=A0A8C9FXY4_PAVCR
MWLSRLWGSNVCLNEGLVSFSKIMFLTLVSVFSKQEDAIQKEGHVRWGEGFVLVYDITDRGSFEEVLPLKNLLDEVKKPKNVTLILVGNKADLDHSRQERATLWRPSMSSVVRYGVERWSRARLGDEAPPRTSSRLLIRCLPKSAAKKICTKPEKHFRAY